jgi:hypothetical protein
MSLAYGRPRPWPPPFDSTMAVAPWFPSWSSRVETRAKPGSSLSFWANLRLQPPENLVVLSLVLDDWRARLRRIIGRQRFATPNGVRFQGMPTSVAENGVHGASLGSAVVRPKYGSIRTKTISFVRRRRSSSRAGLNRPTTPNVPTGGNSSPLYVLNREISKAGVRQLTSLWRISA